MNIWPWRKKDPDLHDLIRQHLEFAYQIGAVAGARLAMERDREFLESAVNNESWAEYRSAEIAAVDSLIIEEQSKAYAESIFPRTTTQVN